MTQQIVLSPRARQAHQLVCGVLGSPPASAVLDDLVRRAVLESGANGGQISMLVDRSVALSAQGFLADHAPDGSELAFEDTMCSVALRTDEILNIPDTRADPRVSSIESVVIGLVGAYLGVPLRVAGRGASGPVMVGVLCVHDGQARVWTAAEVSVLEELAGRIVDELARVAAAEED